MNDLNINVSLLLIGLGTKELQEIFLKIYEAESGILYKDLVKQLPKEFDLARSYLVLISHKLIDQEYSSLDHFGLNNLKLSVSKIGKFFIEELFTINKKLCERIK